MKLNKASLLKRLNSIDIDAIGDVKLRNQARRLKAKQAGFTLLELLVVMAILAAIAGTATIALQDTNARASAAAHVAMMDELNKGVRTFRVLKQNQFPNNFDSLIQTSTTIAPATPINGELVSVSAIDGSADVGTLQLTADAVGVLSDIGISNLMYIDTNLDGDTTDTALTCNDLAGLIGSRANSLVAGNIFMTQSPKTQGCGVNRTLEAGDEIMVWTGGYERVLGSAGAGYDATPITITSGAVTAAGTVDAPVLMAVGFGPSSTLFNANDLGGMTSVPVYRHVSPTEYNRFIGLFNIGTFTDAASAAYNAADQVSFVGVVDGAGDTKEEELGEWDGTRNTI